MSEPGPVEIPRGKIVAKRWKILKKLGEGGCGAVYKVEDMESKNGDLAALKAESNNVSGGSVLKLEVQILRRLTNKPHVAQLLHSGKKEQYCYMVMTLLGESLNYIVKRVGRTASVSTQIRIGINILYGVKQIHEIGFVHRDLKPANVAIGQKNTPQARYLHILDFGLAREFVVMGEDGKPKMRRARPKALFRGTTRYCSINTHERLEQGRVDDLWSLLYLLAELRGSLPWATTRDKKEVHEIKKRTELDSLLENSPVELVRFAQHLQSLTYYNRPDYVLLFGLLQNVLDAGKFKFTDPWDWERGQSKSRESTQPDRSTQPSTHFSKETASAENVSPLPVPNPVTGTPSPAGSKEPVINDENPFPAEEFATNLLGF